MRKVHEGTGCDQALSQLSHGPGRGTV
jgi:hypothetical protein